jgi:hypothetical protein
LWLQQQRGTFLDQTANSGLTRPDWRGTGFGTVMADFDNDGGLDLAVANGRVTRTLNPATSELPRDLDPFWTDYCERDQLFLNSGDGKFRDVSSTNHSFCGVASVSRGLACADFDDDGGVDLLVTRIADKARLFRNLAPHRGNYLIIKATDPVLGRDAYGAEVYVEVGDKRWMRWINPGYSFLCSNDPRAHFGLGTMESYDAVEVVWPDGSAERFPGGPANRVVHLKRGQGILTE